jgi:predicted PurR-regulated permease PerM
MLLIVVTGAWLLGALVNEAQDAARRLNESGVLNQLATLRIRGVNIGAEFAKFGGTAVSWLSGQAFAIFGSATRTALNLVIAFFGLYYLLLMADELWEETRRFLPFSAATAESLRLRFHNVTEAMTLGTALTGALQGTIVGLGFLMVGLPNALFWGVVTACASILPVLGSAFVWLPASIILFARHHIGSAIALAAIGGVVASNIDNVIRPLIYKRVSNIHPMITLVGAFGGVSTLGLVGLLLGPLAITYFFELLRAYEEEFGPAGPAKAAAQIHAD